MATTARLFRPRAAHQRNLCQRDVGSRILRDQLDRRRGNGGSALKGNGQARNGIDDDGDGRIDECDDLDGIQDWWGSCHAWVPASLLEKEPLTAGAEVNGVRFEVSDIKALLILLYDESRQIAVGERCTLNNPPRMQRVELLMPHVETPTPARFISSSPTCLDRCPALGEDRVATEQVWKPAYFGPSNRETA